MNRLLFAIVPRKVDICLKIFFAFSLSSLFFLPCKLQSQSPDRVVVVVGAGGEEEFARQFSAWAERWMKVAKQANLETHLISEQQADKEPIQQLEELISSFKRVNEDQANTTDLNEQTEVKDSPTTWIILIGHGTFDGTVARFNLRGPDVTAEQLAEWLNDLRQPTVVINCSSSSGPFINKLVAKDRVIVTATRSGNEINFARFGDYLSQAVETAAENSTEYDLDKDGQTSLLELVVTASRNTAEFYKQEKRLATEHALIEDNQDGLGTPVDWFRGIRTVKKAKSGASPDGLKSNQLFLVLDQNQPVLEPEKVEARNRLERDLERLRNQKSSFTEDEYYAELEKILVKLAMLYGG